MQSRLFAKKRSNVEFFYFLFIFVDNRNISTFIL
jgi:hypothetical protein